MPTLQEIFEHELQDLFSAESQLVAALPKMQKACSTPELAQAFATHLEQTKEHKNRIQQVGKLLQVEVKGESCKAMEGLVKESQGLMEDFGMSAARDAALIAAAQRVEHYEISAYGSTIALAKALGFEEAAAILDTTLQEEGDTDKLLTEISLSTVVPKALQDDEQGGKSAGSAKGSAKGSSKGSQKDAKKGSNGSSQDLESMTKEELYQMAQEREVDGRSSMDKAQLMKALA